ncbi:hypothetical protein, partial [uncultured Dubosiella sp.]|uniref:hypothetical protein n=1 Tax=uncultured Dubosiella sp. TaxID=1937011 RepID=UPI00272BC18B
KLPPLIHHYVITIANFSTFDTDYTKSAEKTNLLGLFDNNKKRKTAGGIIIYFRPTVENKSWYRDFSIIF